MAAPQIEWIPNWARNAIFYHIYALGFFGAPPVNNQQSSITPRLAELPNWYDHIADLGVTAIHLGPIFESISHGYDTIDYFRIDRRLGDTLLFRQIVDELHGRGIRIILDGVFHHTGRSFFAFQDICQHKRDSEYVNWYYINWGADSQYGDGFAYDCWEGHQALPRLNLDNPDTRHYIFEVTKMWLGDYGLDGWRLDVAHQISPDFWWEFRRVSKSVNPECFLLGEVFSGDLRTWVAPDLLDSGTNYPLYKAIWSALNESNFWEIKAVMERAAHPEFGVFKDLALLNFLGNHDVNRILSQLSDPRLLYPALIFQFTVPGIPCIYYGDEVGMEGVAGGDNQGVRQPMPLPQEEWPDRERAIYREMIRLVGIRKEHPALLYGSFAALETGYTVLSFLRQHIREQAVVVLNSGDKIAALTAPVGREGIPDGVVFRDMLDPAQPVFTVQSGNLVIDQVYPFWGRILIAEM
ncbi:MAG: alpha-amylase [Anaerolineae bacterium]|nr:alpha-amylase [Anaerolineae bacterium]